MNNEQQKTKQLWQQNQKFRRDKGKYNVFLADYKNDSKDDIDDVNNKANHSEENNKDSTQYVIAAHLSNKLFMYLLTAEDIRSAVMSCLLPK